MPVCQNKTFTKIQTARRHMTVILERFSRAGPRGRGRVWATLGEHPLTWLLSNNRLEKVPFVSVLHTSSNRLLLSNQDKGCTPSVAHSLPLPLGPALLNLWIMFQKMLNWSCSGHVQTNWLMTYVMCRFVCFHLVRVLILWIIKFTIMKSCKN